MKKVLPFFFSLVLVSFLSAQIPTPTGAAFDLAKAEFNKIVKDIPFAYGSAELKLNDPQYSIAGISIDAFMKNTLIPALSKLVNLLPADKQVTIEGGACKTGSEEADGGFMGNIELSKKRAEALRSYILANSQLKSDRFKIVAAGSSNTKAGLDAADHKNCRAAIRID